MSQRQLCHREILADRLCWEISSERVVSPRLRRLIARRFATEVVPKLLVVSLAAAAALLELPVHLVVAVVWLMLWLPRCRSEKKRSLRVVSCDNFNDI